MEVVDAFSTWQSNFGVLEPVGLVGQLVDLHGYIIVFIVLHGWTETVSEKDGTVPDIVFDELECFLALPASNIPFWLVYIFYYFLQYLGHLKSGSGNATKWLICFLVVCRYGRMIIFSCRGLLIEISSFGIVMKYASKFRVCEVFAIDWQGLETCQSGLTIASWYLINPCARICDRLIAVGGN